MWPSRCGIFLSLFDEWPDISAKLTWATAAWYHAISNLPVFGYSFGQLQKENWAEASERFSPQNFNQKIFMTMSIGSIYQWCSLGVFSGSYPLPSSESTGLKKYSLRAIDLNIFLSNKYRKLVLFLQSVQHNIRLKNIHCKCEIIKGLKYILPWEMPRSSDNITWCVVGKNLAGWPEKLQA